MSEEESNTETVVAASDLGDMVDAAVAAFQAEGKNWYKSKACWGAIVAGLSAVAGLIGINISPEDSQTAITLFSSLGAVIGSVLAFYGRIKAKGAITSKSTATGAGTAATAGLLLALGLALWAGPAWAADGGTGVGLWNLGLVATAFNLIYAMASFLCAMLVWFWIVDRKVLKGFDTRAEIQGGNQAVAQFAGLSFVGMCLLIGLSVG
jgi:hypothetical protein